MSSEKNKPDRKNYALVLVNNQQFGCFIKRQAVPLFPQGRSDTHGGYRPASGWISN